MALPNPVIVVPGITASGLRDEYAVSPETVWSAVLNLAHRLIVSHFRGRATKGVWGRPAPGVERSDWEPPIRGLPFKE